MRAYRNAAYNGRAYVKKGSLIVPDSVVVPPDPYLANVVMHLKGEGANGSTTFTDAIGNIWTPAGNPVISTAEKIYGNSSMKFDSFLQANLISTPYNSIFTPGNQDFTLEFWIYLVAWPSVVSRLYYDSVQSWPDLHVSVLPPAATLPNTPRIYAAVSSSGSGPIGNAYEFPLELNTWTYFNVTRYGGSLYWQKNSRRELVNNSLGTTSLYSGSTPARYIGGQMTSNNYGLKAYIDNFRYTIGVARPVGITLWQQPPDTSLV